MARVQWPVLDRSGMDIRDWQVIYMTYSRAAALFKRGATLGET